MLSKHGRGDLRTLFSFGLSAMQVVGCSRQRQKLQSLVARKNFSLRTMLSFLSCVLWTAHHCWWVANYQEELLAANLWFLTGIHEFNWLEWIFNQKWSEVTPWCHLLVCCTTINILSDVSSHVTKLNNWFHIVHAKHTHMCEVCHEET